MVMTPYTQKYSFADFEAVSPSAPKPGTELDNEFAGIETAIAAIIAALDDVRREDGNLENGIVSWDALKEDVQRKIQVTDQRLVVSEAGNLAVLDKIVVGDIAPQSFAAETEATAGVANDRLMTPLRTKQAVDSYRAFASQTEAQEGTSVTTVMSPERSTEHLDEKRPFATEAQAQAGTEAAAVLSPESGRQMLDALRTAHTGSANLTWGSIASGGAGEQTLTVAGAQIGDRVMIGLPASGLDAGLIANAWVSAADNVKIRFTNVTAGAITPYGGSAVSTSATALRF